MSSCTLLQAAAGSSAREIVQAQLAGARLITVSVPGVLFEESTPSQLQVTRPHGTAHQPDKPWHERPLLHGILACLHDAAWARGVPYGVAAVPAAGKTPGCLPKIHRC